MEDIYSYINKPLKNRELIWIDDQFLSGDNNDLDIYINALQGNNIDFSLFGDPEKLIHKMKESDDVSSIKFVILDARLPGKIATKKLLMKLFPKLEIISFFKNLTNDDEVRTFKLLYQLLKETLNNPKFIVLTNYKNTEQVEKIKEEYPSLDIYEKGTEYSPDKLIEDVYEILDGPKGKKIINDDNKLTIFQDEIEGIVDTILEDRAILKLNKDGQVFYRVCPLDILISNNIDQKGQYIKIAIRQYKGGNFNVNIEPDIEKEGEFKLKFKNSVLIERDNELNKYKKDK